jgi:hypothetical protein
MAVSNDLNKANWTLSDISAGSVGSWEPSYDTELWMNKKILSLFVQNTTQIDGEGTATVKPQPVQVIEWRPRLK